MTYTTQFDASEFALGEIPEILERCRQIGGASLVGTSVVLVFEDDTDMWDLRGEFEELMADLDGRTSTGLNVPKPVRAES